MEKPISGTTRIRSYIGSFSRRKGKALSPKRQACLERVRARYEIKLPENLALIDVKKEFAAYADQPITLEIGFGAGELLLSMALAHPDRLFIGCEPFLNGVATLSHNIEKHNIANIRLWCDDARLLMEQLPDSCIDKVYFLFPDPWRKPRHYKRRLMSQAFLDRLSRIHAKGGELLCATDHVNYGAWILEHVLAHNAYEWTAQEQADWQKPPEEWVRTRYQTKMLDPDEPPLFIHAMHVAAA